MNELAKTFSNDKVKKQLASITPAGFDASRALRMALSEIKKNELLKDCSPKSCLAVTAQAASLGFEINNTFGHVYVVPFKNKKKNTTEATLVIGYKGFIELARRSGQIESITAHEVRENDYFEFQYGLNQRLDHIPSKENRGPIIGFYAVAKLKGGGAQFEVMWRNEVDEIRDSSPAYKFQGANSIWAKHYPEMGRKTLIRRLFKYLPISVELQKSVAIDECNEAGISSTIIDIEPEEDFESEATSKSDKVLNQLSDDEN